MLQERDKNKWLMKQMSTFSLLLRFFFLFSSPSVCDLEMLKPRLWPPVPPSSEIWHSLLRKNAGGGSSHPPTPSHVHILGTSPSPLSTQGLMSNLTLILLWWSVSLLFLPSSLRAELLTDGIKMHSHSYFWLFYLFTVVANTPSLSAVEMKTKQHCVYSQL